MSVNKRTLALVVPTRFIISASSEAKPQMMPANDQRSAAECEQQSAVQEVDTLKKCCDHHTGQRREESGQEDGNEHIGGVGRSLLGTVDHDGGPG